MTSDEFEHKLRVAIAQLGNLSAIVKFDLGDEGQWLVDARQAIPSLSQDDGDADCTISTSQENLLKLLEGRLDPMLAYTLGKLKVQGAMGVAMKLVAALG